MEAWVTPVVTIICAVLASSGFWAFLTAKRDAKQKDKKNDDVESKVLLGLGHDRITWLGMKYIERGWITKDEYENLYEYLYKPYAELGGNGSAKRVMDEVNKLEIRPGPTFDPRNIDGHI